MEFMLDTFNESVSTILERKVRSWLGGVIEEMRRSSPVQQWLDSCPSENNMDSVFEEESINHLDKNENTEKESNISILQPNLDDATKHSMDMFSCNEGATKNYFDNKKKLQRDYSVQSEGHLPKPKNPLLRDYSLQSDGSGSSGSSVLNVLGARKVDAEEVLLALGFGPSEKQKRVQRIPERFLVPSKLKGISTEQFIKEEQMSMRMHDCGIFGYRGLTGNPHVPPSTIVAKIMECILQSDLSIEETPEIKQHAISKTQDSSKKVIISCSSNKDNL